MYSGNLEIHRYETDLFSDSGEPRRTRGFHGKMKDCIIKKPADDTHTCTPTDATYLLKMNAYGLLSKQ